MMCVNHPLKVRSFFFHNLSLYGLEGGQLAGRVDVAEELGMAARELGLCRADEREERDEKDESGHGSRN